MPPVDALRPSQFDHLTRAYSGNIRLCEITTLHASSQGADAPAALSWCTLLVRPLLVWDALCAARSSCEVGTPQNLDGVRFR